MAEPPPADPAGNQGAQRLLRPQPCAARRRSDARARRAVARRPQRHGQDDAVQGDRRDCVPAASGSIRFMGEELIGRTPAEIARLGLGYVPQGRRLWPSLTVDEHLRLPPAGGRRDGRSRASTTHFRGWPSGATTAATSSPAASSRCWRSRARCCSIRSFWSWTSRPRALRR